MTKTELVELLKDLEWEGWAAAGGDGIVSACPWCSGARDVGHDEKCELARAIAEGA